MNLQNIKINEMTLANAAMFARNELAKEHNASTLRVLATNWKKWAAKNDSAEISVLADKADEAAAYIELDAILPTPNSDDALEMTLYENCKKAMAVTGKPSSRITQMFKRWGYAEAMLRQATKSVGGGKFEELADAGKIELTAEYTVYTYLRNKVAPKVLESIQLLLIENDVEAFA